MTKMIALLTVAPALAMAVSTPAQAAVPEHGMKLYKTYRGDGDWQTSTLKLKKRDYKATVKYNCTDESGGFMYLTWDGDPYGYEYAHSSRARGTVTLNGHEGASRGYFEISTWIDCSWTLKIYQ